jgi:hypothetical protein
MNLIAKISKTVREYISVFGDKALINEDLKGLTICNDNEQSRLRAQASQIVQN